MSMLTHIPQLAKVRFRILPQLLGHESQKLFIVRKRKAGISDAMLVKSIVGAHIVSKEASALIQQILIAMQHNITVEKLKDVCFAHPTFSEGIFEAICRL